MVTKSFLLSILVGASFLVSSTSASPAVVWKKSEGQDGSLPSHVADDVSAAELLSTVFTDDSASGVIFFIGRGSDGSNSFSSMSDKLPLVAAKASSEATAVYHHVSGLNGAGNVIRESSSSFVEVTLEEFRAMNASPEDAQIELGASGIMNKAQKRARFLSGAKNFVVNVPATSNPSVLDEVVANTINKDDTTVILTSQASFAEITHARDMEKRRTLKLEQRIFEQKYAAQLLHKDSEHRRRLEDRGNNNANNDNQSTARVSMTPNILAGLLFTFLFTFIALIGFNCMGSISGQDVFVSKYPVIGKEA